jgi:Peptidase family S41
LAYERNFAQLQAEAPTAQDPAMRFCQLAKLTFPLQDNHLSFREIFDYHLLTEKRGFTPPALPKTSRNLDSLRAALAAKPADSVEGIYHYDDMYRIGVYKNGEGAFVGVVLDGGLNVWTPGEIACYLFEQGPLRFKAVYAHPFGKFYIYHPLEKFIDGALINSLFYVTGTEAVYRKMPPGTPDHVNISLLSPPFQRRSLARGIQYLRLGNFSNFGAMKTQSDAFFTSIVDSLSGEKLILDLRNNQGGSSVVAKKYLQLVEKFAQKGKVYILVNARTLSQGELFTLQLRRLPNVSVWGQNTQGMLAYGSNYGRQIPLPSGKYEFYGTDMKNGLDKLRYEDLGIAPDQILSSERDWIAQVLERISN